MNTILTELEQNLYDSLLDDRSRQVFMARKSYAETGVADFSSIFGGRALKPPAQIFKQLVDKTFVCYGAGNGCREFLSRLSKTGLSQNCRAVYDSNPALHGQYLNGQAISEFDLDTAVHADLIVITPMFYSVSDQIRNYLLGLGIEKGKLLMFSDYFADNDIDLYFDEQILIRLQNDEIFVDGGCLDFATSSLFLNHCPDAKKIYAFEPDKDQIEVIARNVKHVGYDNVKIINGALWSVDTELNFSVSADKSGSRVTSDILTDSNVHAYALDHIIETGDHITFIKMDIEGSELEALKGARNIIKRERPKLAISLYHKPLDYIDIPAYIKSLVPEYQMFLRHYTTSDSETVLYCCI